MAIYSFIAEEQANQVWKVAEMCRVLEVSRSGFYDWQNREPSERELTDQMLAVEIEAIWECSDRSYGVPRMHRWLLKQGFEVGRNRVARIMRANGWEGETGRRRVRTTIVDRGATAAQDRVNRDFDPEAPNSVWCGDITYLRTGEGWLFLATVIDLFSRRVIGWSVADHMRTELVADALDDGSRHPQRPRRGRCRLPFRSRIAIHLGRVRRSVRALRGAAIDGCDRGVLG